MGLTLLPLPSVFNTAPPFRDGQSHPDIASRHISSPYYTCTPGLPSLPSTQQPLQTSAMLQQLQPIQSQPQRQPTAQLQQVDEPVRPITPNVPENMEIDAEGNVRSILGPITSTAEIDNTIHHPGTVKINVKGAFIVDTSESPKSSSSSPSKGSPTRGETKGIRLPNHTAVVSHVAVDVRNTLSSHTGYMYSLSFFFPSTFMSYDYYVKLRSFGASREQNKSRKNESTLTNPAHPHYRLVEHWQNWFIFRGKHIHWSLAVD